MDAIANTAVHQILEAMSAEIKDIVPNVKTTSIVRQESQYHILKILSQDNKRQNQ